MLIKRRGFVDATTTDAVLDDDAFTEKRQPVCILESPPLPGRGLNQRDDYVFRGILRQGGLCARESDAGAAGWPHLTKEGGNPCANQQ